MNYWREYLPSKKIQIVIGVIGIIALGFLVYFLITKTFTGNSNNNQLNLSLINEDKATSEYYKDSDNDGAYDWQEALWPELDPNNPDSDGDGVLDGKYLREKIAIQERQRLGITADQSNLTETEKLSRSLSTALLAIEQSGGSIDDPETRDQISGNVINYINDLTLGDTLYTRDQFSLVENTKVNSFAYRDAMKKLFTTYPIATSDIETLVTATENPAEYQGQLRSAASKYRTYLNALVELNVPYNIAGRHTELTNNVSQIAAALENLTLAEPDELVSLSAVIQIEKILNVSADAIVKINTYFDIISSPGMFPGE